MAGIKERFDGRAITVTAGTAGMAWGVMRFTVVGKVAAEAREWNDAHEEAVDARDTLEEASTVSADPAVQAGLQTEVGQANQSIKDIEAIQPQFIGLGAEIAPLVIAASVGYSASRAIVGIGSAVAGKLK